jgi:hypothetical protein
LFHTSPLCARESRIEMAKKIAQALVFLPEYAARHISTDCIGQSVMRCGFRDEALQHSPALCGA